jgi:methionyl-tRNA formyltransferase
MALRVVFMGTPDFAVPALQAIMEAGHDVVAIYTRAPQPKGRGQHITKSPVHDVADAHNIPVYTPVSLKKSSDACAGFTALNADVAVVAAYGLILPQIVLDAPKYGCINIHASLLPRWRGASPMQQAIWAGDAQTGVTIMQMAAGLDTGPMIKPGQVDILPTTTLPILHDQLAYLGGRLIVDVLADLDRNGRVVTVPQPDTGVTHAPMLKKEDGKVDWAQNAGQIDRQIRALNPWPATFTTLPDGQIVKILAVGLAQVSSPTLPSPLKGEGRLVNTQGDVICGHGTVLRISEIQAPTGKKMDIAALINGGYIKVGQCFGL